MRPGRLMGLGLVGATLVALTGPAWAAKAPPAPTPESDCCKPLEPAPAPESDVLAPATLTNQRDQSVSLPDGRVWVVTFFYGHCRDVCPTLLYNLGSVFEALPPAVRAKVGFAGVSFDPARDTVPMLAEYQKNFELTDSQYHLMIGDQATSDRVFKTFRFSFKPDRDDTFQHVNLMAVMDGKGRVVRHFYGLQPNIEQVAGVVKELVAKP